LEYGARGETRTLTSKTLEPKSSASTNSATLAKPGGESYQKSPLYAGLIGVFVVFPSHHYPVDQFEDQPRLSGLNTNTSQSGYFSKISF
jgi:hypothetical protein